MSQKTGRAEQKLAEDNQRLQALSNNTLDAILLADDQARCVEANSAASELLGYSREEILRKNIWDLTPNPNQELGKRIWNEFLATGRSKGEYSLLKMDGTICELEYHGVANILPGLHLLRFVTLQNEKERNVPYGVANIVSQNS